jgi:predicted phosphodiesterase
MAFTQEKSTFNRRVILHHLSDIRFTSTDGSSRDDVLVKYQRYLEELTDDREPDLVVITGDLTERGTRTELNAVAVALQICFSRWSEHLDEHVFIVPGPHDVNWESVDANGLQEFYKILSDFGFALPYHVTMASKRDTPAHSQANFIGYLIDTCYSADDLTAKLEANVERYSKEYRTFVGQRDRMRSRASKVWLRLRRPLRTARVKARAARLGRLRTQYLQLTENTRLIDLHAGRITIDDIARFERWTRQSTQNATPGGATPDPLKVLITYHPVAIHPAESAAANTLQLAEMARNAGFHLALHGHIHNPQVISDMSAFAGPNNEGSIRQLGAASLDAMGVFNEVTAIYQELDGKGSWGLDLRQIVLKAHRSAASTPAILLTSADAADKRIKMLERAATQRSEFERAMLVAMRRFSEQAYEARPTSRQERPGATFLPQGALLLVQDVIRNVIFRDYDVRVRLLLKDRERLGAAPKLTPTYLSPATQDGPDALVYPASIAAWSLVLGRTLIYPDVLNESTTALDHDWLRRTNKLSKLLPSLEALTSHAAEMSYPGIQAAARYSNLHSMLKNMDEPGAGADATGVAGNEIFQPASSGNGAPSYPTFICVPYPMRPSGGSSNLPEIAVLDISVRQRPPSGRQRADAEAPSEPFTTERIEMLETLAELVGMMLTTADALDRPRGIWDDRL